MITSLLDVPAPAKLNLFLHVIGRRADGYHLLQSPFVLVDWCDTLHFERRADGRLARHDLGPALPADDLTLRAARALQQASGTAWGADISVDKQLPWGAGMGGGSSDAATALLALNRLWGLHWPRERLLPLAAKLGADVPFFVGGHNAFVEGIGEKLTPMALRPRWFAVVKPAASIDTAGIFGDPALVRDTDPAILSGSLADDCVCEDLAGGYGRNDLQPVAQSRCPEVAQAARWLEQRFGNSRMTGSGSAVFARAGTGAQPMATFPADLLPPGWAGRMCRSLEQHPLAGWAG
jgi:4-diphosphocytidyl-2-C-methyl-D-erythritol kinase